MKDNIQNQTGVSTQLPNITNSIYDYNNRLTDYHFRVDVKDNQGNVEEVIIHRNTLTIIRNIVKEVATIGYHKPINNIRINRRFNFLNINVNKAGFKDVELEDVDVFIFDKKTQTRFTFNMKDVKRVHCLSETSTGIRTNNSHRQSSKKQEEAPKNEEETPKKKRTRRVFKTEEERIAARKGYYEKIKEWRKKNPEKIRAYSAKRYARLKAEGKVGDAIYKNPEKRRKYRQEWIKNNPEKVRGYVRKWQAKNPDKVRAYARKRQEMIRAQKALQNQNPS